MTKRVLVTTLLIVSIGLNLLFVGILIGRHMSAGPPGRPHFDWMMQGASKETRSKLRESMREQIKTTRPARRALRSAQEKLHAAITAKDYVEADVITGLAEVRRASGDLQETMHEQLVHNLRKLEPEERVQALRMMSNRDRNRPPGPPRPERGQINTEGN